MLEREVPNQYEKKSIAELRDMFSPEHHDGIMFLTDLDETVKESFKSVWPDGMQRRVLPETINAFRYIHQANIPLGIATEQAFTEIEPFLEDVTKLTLGAIHTDPYELFNGIIIGEGGSVVRRPAKNGRDAQLVVLAPEGALHDKEKILEWIKQNLLETNIEGWQILNGVDPETGTYVSLPDVEDQPIATLSLWERGPYITDDQSYIGKYQKIEDRVKQGLAELGITTLKTYEAGNGTLRIVPRTASKAHTMELLAAYGAVDRKKIMYACDGPNDIALARQLKRNGGSVIAVANAVPEIHELADFSATLPAGKGFAEAVATIIRY